MTWLDRAQAEGRVPMLTKQRPNFRFDDSICVYTRLPQAPSYYPLSSPSSLPPKMADSDLFDGAIGIDLGTTYSYVSVLAYALHF